uniref:G-protein coupled receptors family 1 profile domain-containing protein n=1 Tax=Plectus sambesii TaxID=2011161 RepID=A0A914UJA1_9BILA
MSNSTTSTDQDPDPNSAMWLGIIYAVYGAIGIPINVIVLLLTIKVKSVRAIPLNICIFSMALADMMVLVSFLSSTIWAFSYNVAICKVMGVGVYIFVPMSMLLPGCLAVCRYAGIYNERELDSPYLLRALKKRKGIYILNIAFWMYGLLYTLPFVATDKFGLDAIGCCGITEINSVFLWVYYLVNVVFFLFLAYVVSFVFYRKIGRWVKETSSASTLLPHTRDTLKVTRNLQRMIKWMLFVPVVFYYPALGVQAALRLSPGIVDLHAARLFMITVPLPHIIDPIITLIFVKCYRTAFFDKMYWLLSKLNA